MNKKDIIGICEFLKIHHFENAYTLLDYIDNLQKKAELGSHYKHLYSELKKQKDDVVEYIKSNCIVSDEWTELDFCNFVPTGKINYKALNKEKIKDLLRMLGEIDE